MLKMWVSFTLLFFYKNPCNEIQTKVGLHSTSLVTPEPSIFLVSPRCAIKYSHKQSILVFKTFPGGLFAIVKG